MEGASPEARLTPIPLGTLRAVLFLLAFSLAASPAVGQKYRLPDGRVSIAIVINPYNGDRAGPEKDIDAAAMMGGGLLESLARSGVSVARVSEVALTPEQARQYGRWNQFGMANGNLAAFARENERAGHFNIGLYNNCSSTSGMAGGLQQSGSEGEKLRVGLVWIDAHGDYNTPETTLSGMLGGMPVAVAAGHALHRMRIQSGLEIPLRTDDIVMTCVRDTDPLEQERIEETNLAEISTHDIRTLSQNVRDQMERLSAATDLIYIHIDLDVLDPAEVPGHPLTVPDGPSSQELADALALMFEYPKAAALGIASYPAHDDPGLVSLRAVHGLIDGAIRGLKAR